MRHLNVLQRGEEGGGNEVQALSVAAGSLGHILPPDTEKCHTSAPSSTQPLSLCVYPCAPECYINGREGRMTSPHVPRLGDLTVVPGAVLRRTLGRPNGLGTFETVPFAASSSVGQRVGPAVHHDRVHAVCHGEGLQVALDGHGKWQLINEVHWGAGHDGAAAQVLQTEYCKNTKDTCLR